LQLSDKIQTYLQTGWTLEALLASPEGADLKKILDRLEEETSALEALRPMLGPDMDVRDFAEALRRLEAFSETANRLGSYGQLWFASDTGNQDALAFMGAMDQRLTDAQNRILFFSLWWRGLTDEAAAGLMAHAGDAGYYLEKERLFKEHTLSEPEERIINIKDVNGVQALITLYDMITNKLVFELDVDGQTRQMSRDELMTYVRNPSPEIRAAAYQSQFRVYQKEATVLAQVYSHRVRDWESENMKLRSFSSSISVRNRTNDIPDGVVDTLLDVCMEQAQVFQRYFRLKAEWLGLAGNQLRRYDLYAPLRRASDKKIAYADAVDMVLESFGEFSPVVADLARRVFDDGHIDSEIRPNKRGGAFCAGILPGLTPWVLVNYTGEPRQVATLAHELGHTIHALMAAEHSVLTFHSALPMAETASVFSEMLLTDRLLACENDPAVRRDLLAAAVDDAYATVLRQACFVLFERDAHRMICEGQTMDDLNRHYLSNLTGQFGDSVLVSDDFQYEWVTIPHIFHTPFYCYAYSFGQLLSLSLYRRYKEEGSSFVPRLFKILAYGGSAGPGPILAEAGIDMGDPDFWRGGFRVIEGMIDFID
jgi:oligoendopeptidase F